MTSPPRTILLHVANDGIYLNDRERVDWSMTNFPAKANFYFSEFKPHYWRVRQDAYDRTTGKLTVTVIHFNVSDPQPLFSQQIPKAPIHQIHFQEVKWLPLQEQLSMYKKEAFTDLLERIPQASPKSPPPSPDTWKPEPRRISIDSRIPLGKLRFKLGFVEAEKRIPGVPEPVPIQLANPHILPEFEIIKPFFGKLFGKRTIQVTGYAEVVGRLVKSVTCTSPDLDQINDQSISIVRQLVLRDSIRSKQTKQVDKSLFSSDEFFEDTPAETLGNTYRDNERLLLEEIIQAQEVRNGAQLRYLSGHLQEATTPLKFTIQPHFGFVFHHLGDSMHHFLWELLNTNATYLWSLPRGPFNNAIAYQLLEREINAIREHGRMTYLHQAEKTAFVFHRIPHEHSNSALIDGFPIWRSRVEEKLV
ncbi:MAG: hypothetical protein K9I85_05420 [Saprospiraceae bacterium]|nr:hypothetical protein [Saprospiraceae bacterium]